MQFMRYFIYIDETSIIFLGKWNYSSSAQQVKSGENMTKQMKGKHTKPIDEAEIVLLFSIILFNIQTLPKVQATWKKTPLK